MKRSLALILVLLSGVVQAADILWDAGGSDSKFSTAANWVGDVVPAGTNTAVMNIGGTVTCDDGQVLALDNAKIEGGTVFDMSGGTLDASKPGNSIRFTVGRSGTGTVNQSGGEMGIGHLLVIGWDVQGDYTLSGGLLNVSRGGNSLQGSPMNPSISMGPGSGAGTLTITGGALTTRAGVELGANDMVAISGSDASLIGIGSHGDTDGFWNQLSGATLRVGIDLGGLTKIYVDDVETAADQFATFAVGTWLDVDYYDDGYGGGTWTVLEIENGDITDNGLAFAAGVDTSIWSFAVDNSGVNGKLTVTAEGEPAPPQPDATLTVGNTRKQMMRYGLDYERLWFWYGSQLAPVPQWSVNDCNIDYIRCAMNSGYELTENVFDLSAYTQKIIPMMTAMQEANPHIKWFASPRPLNEAVSGAAWQPYPLWVTGAPSYTSGAFDFQAIKCAEYMIKYLLLMKSYGFKITYMDVTNEWQSDFAGGRVTQSDLRDIVAAFQNYLASPWEHPEIPGLVLTEEDFPLMIAPSSWNYQQGGNWIDSLNTQAKKDAVDIAGSHNTDRTGSAQSFADDVATYCNPGTEIWETEQHGWKSTSGANEVTSFSYYMESIRAGFTGINGWLAIGTTSQGHCYLLNNGSTVARNVKYYIFQKLSNTSNYGYRLGINEPAELNNTMALIRENVLTVWVNNTSVSPVLTEIDFSDYVRDASDIITTRWHESLPVEGVAGTPMLSSPSNVIVNVEGESLYCIEIPLADPEDNFPFVQAESYATGSGVSVLPCTDDGGTDMVSFGSRGDEVSFDLDITKTYAHDVAFRVSSQIANIRFDVYDGTNLVGSVDRIATGDAQNWTTTYVTLPLDGGPMELRVVAAAGGWNLNWIRFDQAFFSGSAAPENLALNQPASASSVHSAGFEADKAVDGDTGTRWASAVPSPWLEIDLGALTLVNRTSFRDYGNRTTGYEIQYTTSRTWKTAFVGGNPDDVQADIFPEVMASKIRLQVTGSTGDPSVWEFEVGYDPTAAPAPTASMEWITNGITVSWPGVPGATYSVQRATDLMAGGFTSLETGVPGQEDTDNSATVEIPDDAAFYRILLED